MSCCVGFTSRMAQLPAFETLSQEGPPTWQGAALRSRLRRATRATPTIDYADVKFCAAPNSLRRDESFVAANLVELLNSANWYRLAKGRPKSHARLTRMWPLESAAALKAAARITPNHIAADIEIEQYSGDHVISQVRPFGTTALSSLDLDVQRDFLNQFSADDRIILILPRSRPDDRHAIRLRRSLLQASSGMSNVIIESCNSLDVLDLHIVEDELGQTLLTDSLGRRVVLLQASCRTLLDLPPAISKYLRIANGLVSSWLRLMEARDSVYGPLPDLLLGDRPIGPPGVRLPAGAPPHFLWETCRKYARSRLVTIRQPFTDKAFTAHIDRHRSAIEELIHKDDGLIIQCPSDTVLKAYQSPNRRIVSESYHVTRSTPMAHAAEIQPAGSWESGYEFHFRLSGGNVFQLRKGNDNLICGEIHPLGRGEFRVVIIGSRMESPIQSHTPNHPLINAVSPVRFIQRSNHNWSDSRLKLVEASGETGKSIELLAVSILVSTLSRRQARKILQQHTKAAKGLARGYVESLVETLEHHPRYSAAPMLSLWPMKIDENLIKSVLQLDLTMSHHYGFRLLLAAAIIRNRLPWNLTDV